MQESPAALALAAIVQLLFVYALFAWGRWVARRNGNGRFWRIASYLPWVSMALITIGTIVAVVLLTRSFDAIANVDPASKASNLAAGISTAMGASAVFMIPGYALLVLAIVSFAIGSFRGVQ